MSDPIVYVNLFVSMDYVEADQAGELLDRIGKAILAWDEENEHPIHKKDCGHAKIDLNAELVFGQDDDEDDQAGVDEEFGEIVQVNFGGE
jgi:hypothetical protein